MGQQCVSRAHRDIWFDLQTGCSWLHTDLHVSLPSVISTPSHTAGGRTLWWVTMMQSVKCVGLTSGCTRRPGIPQSRLKILSCGDATLWCPRRGSECILFLWGVLSSDWEMIFLYFTGLAVPVCQLLHSQAIPVWVTGWVGTRFWGEWRGWGSASMTYQEGKRLVSFCAVVHVYFVTSSTFLTNKLKTKLPWKIFCQTLKRISGSLVFLL